MVLVSPRNPLNIGAAARAMSNFGCLRAAAGESVRGGVPRSPVRRQSSKVLEKAREYPTLARSRGRLRVWWSGPLLSVLARWNIRCGGWNSAGKLIARKLASAPVALLFGSEKFGLSNEDMSHCHWLMRIPTREEHGSMNLGQAVAVCLYEIVAQPGCREG